MSHTFHRYKIGDEPVPGYRLTDHLGAGGFGEVWKANAPGGTEVALKIIDLTGQQGVQEFSSLRVVKKVRHPNLISLQAFWMKDESGQIIDEAGQAAASADVGSATPGVDPKRQTQSVGIASTAFFVKPVELIIAMQLGAMSLHKRLEDCRDQGLPGVPVAELLEYLEQAARGIDFLNKPIHDLGKGPVPIVHGDVKPHNILVVGDAAVVCDFGLARAVETLRKTSMAPVTVAYAAPESFKGKVTPTSDQYSLAITYAELRTGRLPFDETMTPYQVMEAHVTRMLDFSRIPGPERDVIYRATEPDPESRWPSSRDMILAMRHAVAKTGELPLRPGEAAYSGGPTPTHSITARPKTRDTDLPTRYPVDPHKETMHPGGNTPSQAFSLQTEHAPPGKERHSDPLAETAMLGPGGLELAPPKKSKTPLILAALAAAAVVVGIAVLPKMFGEKPTPSVPSNSIATNTNPNSSAATNTVEPESTDPTQQYIKRVQGKINSANFVGAVEDLEKAPSKLEEFEKEALQKRLKEKFIAYLDEQLQSGSFGLALVQLQDARRGIGLTADDKQQQREKIRAAWLANARSEFENENTSTALDTVSNLLSKRDFENDRDALLLMARCQIRLQNPAAAKATLAKLGKADSLPVELHPAVAGLTLLAIDPAAQPNWLNILDEYLSYAALEKSAKTGSLALNTWERSRLTNLRDQIEQNVDHRALPADKQKEVLDKLGQLSSSEYVLLAKVRLLLDGRQYADARKSLLALSAKVPPEAEKLKAEVAGTSLLIDLRDSANKPEVYTAAMQGALKLYGSLETSLWNDLCAAAELLALGSQPTLLEPALAMAGKSPDLDAAMSQRYAKLLAQKLTVQTLQPTPPTAEQLRQFVEDCQTVAEAKVANPTVAAFNAECLLLQDSRDRQTLAALIESAKPENTYTQFVQARVLRAMSQPDWAKISSLLSSAYTDVKQPSAVLSPFRRLEAAKLLIDAAGKKRIAVTAANSNANPFGEPKNADEASVMLELARKLLSGADAASLKLSDVQQREFAINSMLAAAWKSKPDMKLAKSESANVAKLTDAELGSNALPALFAVFRANSGADGAPAIAIPAVQRAIELFQKQYPVADPQASKLYVEILKPAIAMADAQAAGKTPPADLDKFYAAAAEFIKHYQRAQWPFPDKQLEIEKLLTSAIKLNAKAPKHFTARAASRISQTPPNIEGAMGDTAEATKLDKDLASAHALRGHALIYRSRQQKTRAARLDDLAQAVATCETAVKLAKPDDDQRAMHLLYLSMALLETANFENSDLNSQKDRLERSLKYAQQAVEIEKDKAYPDYAYTALGNAYEDIAWLVREEPEKNYLAAIEAFTEAINHNPSSADPLIGRARCFYKAVADNKLGAEFLKRTTDEALLAAISDLQQAKQLKPGLVEAEMWIGKVNQYLKKYKEADEAFAAAVELADQQKLPERSIYITQWLGSAAQNPELGSDRNKIVRERAQKLKDAPNLGGASNAKQAALLIGESLIAEKKLSEALKTYDDALVEYEKSDPNPAKADSLDVNLLLARAGYRLTLPPNEWNLMAAEAVIKDASRIAKLKAGPKAEAFASAYAAQAKFKSARSSSSTITAQKKQEFGAAAIDDIRKAISLAPNDPSSIEWRTLGTVIATAKLTPQDTKQELVKSLGPEARQWIHDAIEMAAKRPDLAGQMSSLQRLQTQLEDVLTARGLPRS